MWTVGLSDLDFCVIFPMLYLYSAKSNRNSCGPIYLIYWNTWDGLLRYSFFWPVTVKRASVQHVYTVFRWEEFHLRCLSLASHFLHTKNTWLYWSWVSECSRQNSLMHWGLNNTDEFCSCERVKMTLWGWYYELIKQKKQIKRAELQREKRFICADMPVLAQFSLIHPTCFFHPILQSSLPETDLGIPLSLWDCTSVTFTSNLFHMSPSLRVKQPCPNPCLLILT